MVSKSLCRRRWTLTGAFADLATLQPQPGIVPYDVNVPFLVGRCAKDSLVLCPDTGQFMGFSPNENWSFRWARFGSNILSSSSPTGCRNRAAAGNAFPGQEFRRDLWNYLPVDDAQANAFLVPTEGMDEAFLIHDGATIRTQVWHYPARAECSSCHTPAAGFALGFNTGN